MALLELCFLPVLLAQDPSGPTHPPAPIDTPTVAADDAREKLRAAERDPATADPAMLTELSLGTDAAVAARAAWLLGQNTSTGTAALCCDVAAGSPHAEARRQAMAALLRLGGSLAMPAGIKGLADGDRTVRTLAAQLLGQLRRPGAAPALLALLEQARHRTADGTATDLQAALLAWNDLGTPDALLRIATAIDDGKAAGTGEALAYCFQNLSPKLDRKQEVTLLVAVLGHREQLLRRYAIGRLAELDDASAVQALEKRLGAEGNQLRPLVEVAIAQLRRDDRKPPNDELARAMANAELIGARLGERWQRLDERQRWIAGSVPIALAMALWFAIQLRRRSAAQQAAAATLALVGPSEQYLAEEAAEAEADLLAMAEAAEQTIDGDGAWEGDGAGDGEWLEPGEPGDAEAELAEEAYDGSGRS